MVKGKNKQIKNLICSVAAIPNPFYLIPELLISEWPALRFVFNFKNGIGKFDFKLFKNGRFDGIELVLWGLFDENWNIREKKLIKYKESNLPFCTFHACFESFPPDFKNVYLNLAQKDKIIQKAIKSHIDVVSELGEENAILVLHPGIIKREEEKEEAFKNVINHLEACLDYAQTKRVILTLENMSWDRHVPAFCADFVELKYIIEKIKSPNLKITFDWGHLNTHLKTKSFQNFTNKIGDYFTFPHINRFIDGLGKEIIHAHIHYNRNHIPKFGNLKRSLFKNLILHLFSWTKLSKFIREEENRDLYDEHLTLNKIEEEYLGSFEETVRNLLTKTAIYDFGYVTHEISPKKIFRIFTYAKHGANFSDCIKGLELFKKMIS